MSFPRTPRTRRDRRSLKTLDPSRDLPPAPPPPPSGANVILVRWNADRGDVEWHFDSIILTIDSSPTPFFAIEGYETLDWDGWEENVLYTMHESQPPVGTPWTAAANAVVQTENGGVLGGVGDVN